MKSISKIFLKRIQEMIILKPSIHLKQLLLLVFILGLIASCGKDDDTTPETCTVVTPDPDPDPDPDPIAICNDTLNPIVMLHGALASGDTYATQAMRFTSNDYCEDRLFAFDWNTLGGSGNELLLDAFIDDVLAQTNATQVDLVGHSAGGGLSYTYLSDETRAAKVAHYAHLGSGAQSGPAGPNGEVPTINIYSTDDLIVAGSDIAGAENVMQSGPDHYEIATNAPTFEAMYEFFNDRTPETSEIVEEETVSISGKVVTLGENEALDMATIEIYEVDTATGFRINTMPDTVILSDADGHWGPWQVKKNTNYEFFVQTTDPTDRIIHYYREAFTHSNPLVYLRMFPPAGSTAGLILSGIPEDDNQTAMAVFTASQATIYQRDALMVNGVDLATEELTAANKTTIAMFLYDDNGDGQTSLAIPFTFAFLNTFLTGADFFIPTVEPETVAIEFNNRELNVPNWKSGTDGVIVAVFD